ncbi:MAG TPA: hypothetical protein VF614_07425 [Chthoniobacteraceae bacterium]
MGAANEGAVLLSTARRSGNGCVGAPHVSRGRVVVTDPGKVKIAEGIQPLTLELEAPVSRAEHFDQCRFAGTLRKLELLFHPRRGWDERLVHHTKERVVLNAFRWPGVFVV